MPLEIKEYDGYQPDGVKKPIKGKKKPKTEEKQDAQKGS